MTKISKSEEVKQVTRYLCNMTLLRSYGKQTEMDTLETALKNLTTVFQERKDEEELAKMAQEEKEQRRLAMLEKLQAEGWTLDELLETANKQPKAKQKAPNKYQYVDSQGQTRFWSGFGRTPTELQALLDAGQSLETFLIQKSE